MNITNYAQEISFHLGSALSHLDQLKLMITTDERLADASLILDSNSTKSENSEYFKYWDAILDDKISDERFFLALVASAAPFLFTLIFLLFSMAVAQQVFNLRRKYRRKNSKAQKTLILYSENDAYAHKIAVVDEMKRRKRQLIASHNHKPADFNLPDENVVPMVLIKEFIDNRNDLNAIERLNNQDQILLNVINLENKPNDLRRITTEDIEGAFQSNEISNENPKSYDVSFNRKKISQENNIETKSVDYEKNELNDSKKQKLNAFNSSQKFFRRKTADDFFKNNNKEADIRKFSIFSVTKVHQNDQTNNKDSKI